MSGTPAPQDDRFERYMQERAQYIVDQLLSDKALMARAQAGYEASLRDEPGVMWDDLKRELARKIEASPEG